jgi:RNA polymerase sigma-70 factor (ECF subfamily)
VERITDHELLRRARQGDGGAYEAFYRRHAPVMLAWFRRRTGLREVAEDLTAETFAAALCNVHRFRGEREESAAAWLYAIAARELARYVRHRSASTACQRRLSILLEREPATQGALESAGAEEELARALHALPAAQQEVIRLRIALDLDYADIAAALDCNPATARQRLRRALAQLRRQLTPEKS